MAIRLTQDDVKVLIGSLERDVSAVDEKTGRAINWLQNVRVVMKPDEIAHYNAVIRSYQREHDVKFELLKRLRGDV